MKSFKQFITESIDPFKEDNSIWKYFDKERVMETLKYLKNPKSRSTLIWMSAKDFLNMARTGYDFTKESTVKKYAESTGLSDIPSLMFKDDDNGNAFVTGHEGRHRARFFKEKGFDLIPVEFASNRIRWGSQDNSYDHIDVWPTTLTSEDGLTKIPFPQSAIYPHSEEDKSE